MTRFEIKQGLSKIVAYEAIENKATEEMRKAKKGSTKYEIWKRAKDKAGIKIAELMAKIYGRKEEAKA